MLLNIVYILIFGLGVKGANLVDVACKRNPALPYCNLNHVRRKQANKPEDPFKEKFEPKSIEEPKGNKGDEDISIEIGDTNQIQSSRIRSTTPVSLPPQNILYTIFPTLQNEKNWQKYCPINQYTFQITCLPGKKLRYDLMVFCQEYSDTCGVPNINLYPSRQGREDDGRPKGYGQKQKNGNLGLGTSFGFGLGALPGFEVVSSQGTDIGNENLPLFNQIGGMMLNYGTEMGALGHRIGKGPARSMNSLTHGYPSLGLTGEPNKGDQKLSQEVLKSFGVPNLPGLNKIFNKLGGNRSNKPVKGYEPGYGAVNPNAPLAIGKVDRDALNLPGGFGDVEIEKGGGFGIGK